MKWKQLVLCISGDVLASPWFHSDFLQPLCWYCTCWHPWKWKWALSVNQMLWSTVGALKKTQVGHEVYFIALSPMLIADCICSTKTFSHLVLGSYVKLYIKWNCCETCTVWVKRPWFGLVWFVVGWLVGLVGQSVEVSTESLAKLIGFWGNISTIKVSDI